MDHITSSSCGMKR
ncbi:hypothetical protein R3I94_008134 [Phoxinus phoxinus]